MKRTTTITGASAVAIAIACIPDAAQGQTAAETAVMNLLSGKTPITAEAAISSDKSEVKAKAEQEAKAKAEQEAKAKAEQEAKAKAEQEAKAKAEQEAKAKAEQEAKAKAEQEAKAKAEQEAKAKAEQEAKAKAEQEAKAKAEQEAKAKAEQEAKAKAEQEAKAKAEQEAKAKAEQEAKAKAEQEAKAKAEQEAKAKAEQEAKAKAEQEAKIKISVPSPAELSMPERILSKPGVLLYTSAGEEKSENYLPNYSILEVISRENGRIQVQTPGGKGLKGWGKEGDCLPWKHQMVVQFANPNGRSRTLFFAGKEDALRYAAMNPNEREVALRPAYENIEKNQPVADKAIVACEPEGWATMKSNFYLMPIVEFTDEQSETASEFNMSAIKVSAVTENAARSSEPLTAKNMTLDLVFVMDLSRSMGPLKDQVLKTIRQIAEATSGNPNFKDSMIHFGLWGYRDDMKACPGIEYLTHDYTAEGLQPAAEFVKTLEQAKETRIDSVDYAEDVLAGMKDAIEKTRWREGAARAIILIGDAPGREPGKTDPFSRRKDKPVGTAAEMGTNEIRGLADEHRVTVGTAYVNVPRYKEHLPIARQQFDAMATGANKRATAILSMDKAGDFDNFEREVISWLTAQTMVSSQGGGEIKAETKGEKFAQALFQNARVHWISEAHKVGVTNEMSGWVLDKDLKDPALDSVIPCVLLTRQQLDSVRSILQNVVDAGMSAKGNSTAFFTALQTMVLTAGKNPDMLNDISKLADSRFIPTFLKDLPYRSKVLAMTNEYWQSMQQDEQDEFISNAQNKLKFYKAVYDNLDLWMKPDESCDESQMLTPIPLDQLP